MNEDCLQITTYFGERDRVGDRLLADALLDAYGRHRLKTSLLLRGAEGFGLKHHLRTDRLLTLSEDLPLVSLAVDDRPRIEGALSEVMSLQRTGLVTLERARMLTGTIGPVTLPQELQEATKLTIYLGRQERLRGVTAFAAVTDLLYRRGIAGATVLLGVDGTAHGTRQRAQFFARNVDVPLMIVAVGDGSTIAQVLPELGGLLRRPLLTLGRVRVCKRDGELLARPPQLPVTDDRGLALWQKLMIYSSEQAHHDGQPLHQALIRRLRRSGGAGATALRGIWGFHGAHPPHGDRLLQLRRHVPVVTVVVDTPQRIADAFAIVDEATSEHGLVTSETVPALTALTEEQRRGGLRLARRGH
jgi:PII-like signaling protein